MGKGESRLSILIVILYIINNVLFFFVCLQDAIGR